MIQPYSNAKLKKEFGDIANRMFAPLPSMFVIRDVDTPQERRIFERPNLPFVMSYPYGNAAVELANESATLLTFQGDSWTYILKVVWAISGMDRIYTHKSAEGNMERMVEDIITAKLAL